MPVAATMMMRARALSCRKERKPAFGRVVGYSVRVFKEAVSSLFLCSYSGSLGRLMSLRGGPSLPDILIMGWLRDLDYDFPA